MDWLYTSPSLHQLLNIFTPILTVQTSVLSFNKANP